MRRTFLILCLLAFAGSAGLWAWSYVAADFVAYVRHERMAWAMTHRGWCELGLGDALSAWELRVYQTRDDATLELDRIGHRDSMRWVQIHLSLPVFASALLSLWLWRRGRRRQVGRGFPVEQPPPPPA